MAATKRPGHRIRLCRQSGRHQVIPVPFNQPVIASPSSPTLAGSPFQQNYSYGYNVGELRLPDGRQPYLANYEGGNVDLRVPYIGYAAESIAYKAAGVDAYNALQVHMEKRMSHGIQVGAFLHLLARPRRAERTRPLLQRQQSARSAQRIWLGRLRPHPCDQLQLRPQRPRYVKSSLLGKICQRLVAGRHNRSSERPALQRHRLLWLHRQHLLLHRRRHHQPHRSARQWLHSKECVNEALGAWFPVTGGTALKPHASRFHCCRAGGLNGAIPSSDPYETRFTSGPAQHLPPGLPEAAPMLRW